VVAFRDLKAGLGLVFEDWPARATLRLPSLLLVEAIDESLPTQLTSSNRDVGVVVVCSHDRVVETIFLYSGSAPPFSQYTGELPGGLRFESSSSELFSALGQPTRSGEASSTPGLGEYGAWFRYDAPSSSIHFQLEPHEDRISLITLMVASSVPGS
jgi:hypothetical protein